MKKSALIRIIKEELNSVILEQQGSSYSLEDVERYVCYLYVLKFFSKPQLLDNQAPETMFIRGVGGTNKSGEDFSEEDAVIMNDTSTKQNKTNQIIDGIRTVIEGIGTLNSVSKKIKEQAQSLMSNQSKIKQDLMKNSKQLKILQDTENWSSFDQSSNIKSKSETERAESVIIQTNYSYPTAPGLDASILNQSRKTLSRKAKKQNKLYVDNYLKKLKKSSFRRND